MNSEFASVVMCGKLNISEVFQVDKRGSVHPNPLLLYVAHEFELSNILYVILDKTVENEMSVQNVQCLCCKLLILY